MTLQMNKHASAEQLLQLKSQHLMPSVYNFYKEPLHIVSGCDCVVEDDKGRKYLDCYSGVTVMNAGHCNPAIIEPAIEQIRTLQHTTTIYLTEAMLRLAEELSSLFPGGIDQTFFCASGSEATEGAMMAAITHSQRPTIVAFEHSLHGRTRWSMNATGLKMWNNDPFPMENIIHVPFGDFDSLENVFKKHGNSIACVIGEPIQGNGGVVVPRNEFWKQVRELCDSAKSLLIFDEIQTGFNRTGTWFACEHWGVTPDIITVSKALGNGFPIAAFATTHSIASSCTKPSASTFGGNPVCAVAALATIEFHRENQLGVNAIDRGEQLLQELADIGLFGKGLMLGMKLIDSNEKPRPDKCDYMLELLREKGILAGKTGHDRNVLTLMPPLTLTDKHILMISNAIKESYYAIS